MSGFVLFPPSPGRARPLRCSPSEPDPCGERGAGAVAQGPQAAPSPPSPPAGRAPLPPRRAPAWGDAGRGEGCPDPCFAEQGRGCCPGVLSRGGFGCALLHALWMKAPSVLAAAPWWARGDHVDGSPPAVPGLSPVPMQHGGTQQGLGWAWHHHEGTCGLRPDLPLAHSLASGPDPAPLSGTGPHKPLALPPFWCWSLVSRRARLHAGGQSWFQPEAPVGAAPPSPPLVPPTGAFTPGVKLRSHTTGPGGGREAAGRGASQAPPGIVSPPPPSIFQQFSSVLPGGAVPSPVARKIRGVFQSVPFVLADPVNKLPLHGRGAVYPWGFSCGWRGRRERRKANHSSQCQVFAG